MPQSKDWVLAAFLCRQDDECSSITRASGSISLISMHSPLSILFFSLGGMRATPGTAVLLAGVGGIGGSARREGSAIVFSAAGGGRCAAAVAAKVGMNAGTPPDEEGAGGRAAAGDG